MNLSCDKKPASLFSDWGMNLRESKNRMSSYTFFVIPFLSIYEFTHTENVKEMYFSSVVGITENLFFGLHLLIAEQMWCISYPVMLCAITGVKFIDFLCKLHSECAHPRNEPL